MYDRLRGRLVELSPTKAVVDVGGLGFDLSVPLSTYGALKGCDEVTVLTHMHVREDELRVFAFASAAERELFRLVLSVSGVGPAIALASLSALEPREAALALANEDVKTVRRVKGVGKKLAERMVLELRERAAALLPHLGGVSGGESRAPADDDAGEALDHPAAEDTIKALLELGYDRKVARQKVAEALGDSDAAAATVESLVRACLR